MRFLAPLRQWFLKLALLKIELWVYHESNELAHSREAIWRSTCYLIQTRDTITGQCSQTRGAQQRRERRKKAPEVKTTKRSASKRYKLQESYHGKDNSLELELHLSTAGFKSEE
jgi:hypothetical protein